MAERLKIIVTGLIGQHRFLGGVAWDYLNVVLGAARLGHEVYYIEDSGEWPYNLDGGPSGEDWIARDPGPTVAHLASLLSRFGLEERWAYRFPTDSRWFGLSQPRRKELIASADLLINVSGTLDRPEQYRSVRKLIYMDTDPIFTQIRLAAGEPKLVRRVDAHDAHFSVGECLQDAFAGGPWRWKATKHPIVLSQWASPPAHRGVFTTVMNWTSYKPVRFQGRDYGQKDVEFRRFVELPGRVKRTKLEVAMPALHHTRWETRAEDLSPALSALLREHPDWTPRDLLAHAGWGVANAQEVCGDAESYRTYIQSSMAEWSVAKNGYVRGRSGWFSGRSACYLAAGRPVVVQDTGFAPVLPVGLGVVAFRTMEEAVAAIRDVEGDYKRHAQAARAIAEEYFDSDKVLGRLIRDPAG